MAASFMAVSTSCSSALRTSRSHVPTSVGHAGLHSAHAAGSPSPPSRECVRKNSHLVLQSSGFQQVTAGRTTPLTCASWTKVRGYSNVDSAMPTSVTKSLSACSISAPQKSRFQLVQRATQPTRLMVTCAPVGSRQPVLAYAACTSVHTPIEPSLGSMASSPGSSTR